MVFQIFEMVDEVTRNFRFSACAKLPLMTNNAFLEWGTGNSAECYSVHIPHKGSSTQMIGMPECYIHNLWD